MNDVLDYIKTVMVSELGYRCLLFDDGSQDDGSHGRMKFEWGECTVLVDVVSKDSSEWEYTVLEKDIEPICSITSNLESSLLSAISDVIVFKDKIGSDFLHALKNSRKNG